jgi:hypothetical protein
MDEITETVVCCPDGHRPQSSVHDPQTGKTKTRMSESVCGSCDFRNQCPVKKTCDGYQLDHTAKDRRIAARRKEQDTEVFKERYQVRSGIEATNSGLKRKTGLGRLRIRGRPAVFHAIYMKIAGWNILRAAACAKLRKIVYERACRTVLEPIFAILRQLITTQCVHRVRKTPFKAYWQQFRKCPTLYLYCLTLEKK